ncbi:MAG: EGF domain-containing protein [Kofleriaceae bacterium]|nr:EGF domain-containing protein [Kofleriaceae bacterium]
MRPRLVGWMPIALTLLALTCSLFACAQPTLIECAPGQMPCDDGCVDLATDDENCGMCGRACTGSSCLAGQCAGTGACAINNGGCDGNAACMELGGQVMCLCNPGFTGDGVNCMACTMCSSTQFIATPCTPFADTTCATCAPPCESGMFEAQACGPGDRVCALCSQCTIGQYEVAPCGPTQDTQCGQCDFGCNTCQGPAACLECQNGFINQGGICMPIAAAICSNGIIEPGEMCDDTNGFNGDGCSSSCQVEANHYCFAEPSICNPGNCVGDPATSLPLGPAFALDGDGTTSAGGLAFTERSSIYTTADVNYPVLVEMDVVYSSPDTTIVGTRGTGRLDMNNSDQQAVSVRARLFSSVEIVTSAGDVETSAPTPFTPTLGVPYRVRWFDDGYMVSVEWVNLTNPAEGFAMQLPTQYHGAGDRAFVGGGAQAGLTVSNLRVCDAPALPITADLAAHFSAIPSWTAVDDGLGNVIQWRDTSGHNRNVNEAGPLPFYAPGALAGAKPGLDFGGGKHLATLPFPLTTDVTVFAVVKHRNPDQWGALAHHGNRDTDWSLEQSGAGDSNVWHWQTNNDNVNMELTLSPNSDYILVGRFEGTARYFSAIPLGGSPTSVSIVDASHTITTGNKPLHLGTSDAGEGSNTVIGDLIYYARALSDPERDAMIEYLRATWNP